MISDGYISKTEIVKNIVPEALEAIISLWDEDAKTFWRSTEHRDRDKRPNKEDFFPTVSFCCLQALCEFRTAFPEWPINRLDEVITSSKTVIIGKDINKVESSLSDPDKKLSPFTLAHYIHCLIAIRKLCIGSDEQICEQIKLAAHKLIEEDGIKTRILEHKSNQHPFVVFHVSRACCYSQDLLRNDPNLAGLLASGFEEMLEYVRKTIKELMAQHALGPINASDAIALLFCAATLSLSKNTADHRFVLPALRLCFEKQDSSGCWPLGRVVQENKDQLEGKLEISTYEVAWTVGALIDWCLDHHQNGHSLVCAEERRELLEHLSRTAEYAQGTIIPLPKENPTVRGWCTDHPYGGELIESWTSSNVLQFATSLSNLIERVNGLTALETFKSTAYPTDESWPKWLCWEKYREIYEPDNECPILEYIHKNIIEVIQDSPRQLPSSAKRSVSALLFGPPGTHKTSIVKAIADGLGWPIVSLSPGDFIEKGLEYIEAQASVVFSRLHQLCRVVVLFDECDELFRKRAPKGESEQTRGIAAFVTATMLPKIQDLHDTGRILFFVCTNQFKSMDKAITRGGRVDHVIAVGPPDELARRRILKDMVRTAADVTDEVIQELAKQTRLFTVPELRHVFGIVSENSQNKSGRNAGSLVRTAVDSMKDSLTIGAAEAKTEYNEFKEHKKKYSHPHIERRTRR